MKAITKLLPLLILIFVSGCSLDDNEIPQSNTIQGAVVNVKDEPLAGVTVELTTLSGTVSVQTDQSGRYEFNQLPAGIGVIKLSLNGYHSITRKVTLHLENKTPIIIDIILFNT